MLRLVPRAAVGRRALRLALRAVVALSLASPAALAQADDPAARALAERATARRAQQIADTTLRDYTATARGFLTFLAQVGEGFPEPPKVVKADQLAVQVYWAAPDRSKQVVLGLRDTLLLPADVGYYQDRYGIVQNNFPSLIRLGDGNDVRDVPHPLSAVGLREYRFTLGDSLRIRLPGRTVSVLEVRFRPVDDRQPRAVGTLYVDRETADVARMALTFTDAAILDRRIETLAVTIENGLVEGRFWLPRRQELEVARTSTWLDFPARGIIRGRWEVDDYRVNRGLDPALFAGRAIEIPSPAVLRSYPFEGSVLDALPSDVQAVDEADVARVREQAQALVRAQALRRARGAAVSAGRVSDIVRVNRVEGLAVGLGTSWRPVPALEVGARLRWGFADERLKGRVSIARERAGAGSLELFAERAHRDAGDVQETSLVRNSVAAQEFGSDYTDPYEARAFGLSVALGERLGLRWTAEGAWERQRALLVHATPSFGRFEPTLPAAPVEGARLSLAFERPVLDGAGSGVRLGGEVRGGLFGGDTAFARVALHAEAERAAGAGTLLLRATAAGVAGDALPQALALFGGPTSAPGYAYHALAGRWGASARAEWRVPAPFASIPLGRFGATPPTMTVAPYVVVAGVGETAALGRREVRAAGAYPSVGVAGLFFYDLLRVDVARGLRDGRWFVGVDVARTLWGIM